MVDVSGGPASGAHDTKLLCTMCFHPVHDMHLSTVNLVDLQLPTE